MNGDPDNVAVVAKVEENMSATTNGNLHHDTKPVVKTEVVENPKPEINGESETVETKEKPESSEKKNNESEVEKIEMNGNPGEETPDKTDKPEVENAGKENPDQPDGVAEEKGEPVGDSAAATIEVVKKKKKSSIIDKMKKTLSFRSAQNFLK
jgi:hypothetical protein